MNNATAADNPYAPYRGPGLPYPGYKTPLEQVAASADKLAEQAADELGLADPDYYHEGTGITLAILALVQEIRALRYELAESGGLTANVTVNGYGDCDGA